MGSSTTVSCANCAKCLNACSSKATTWAGYVRERLAEDARTQVKQNPLVTLMMAIGLGFILGFILRGPGRR